MIYECITKKHPSSTSFKIKVKNKDFSKAYLCIGNKNTGFYNSVERVSEDYWVIDIINLMDSKIATSKLEAIGIDYEVC